MPEGVRSRAAGEGWPGGREFSPAAISGNVRFHGSIWNAPLRRRGGFYIRPCNLGQRKTSRASAARPYNALFRQFEAPLKGSSKVRSPLGPLCEGAPPADGGGESCTAVRNISGYGKVLSLRPFGAPLPFWRFAPPPPYRGSLSLRGRLFDTLGSTSRGATLIGGAPQRLPFEGSSRAAGEGWPGCHEIPPTSSPHKNHKTQNRGMP